MNANQIQERLKEGNKRYVSDLENPSSDKELRGSLTGGQQPFAIVLSCADSRVCLLYTSPSPRDVHLSRMPSSA